jgi:hypothetical protein
MSEPLRKEEEQFENEGGAVKSDVRGNGGELGPRVVPPRPAEAPAEPTAGALFSPSEAQKFLGNWDAIQAGFVDEPRKSVEKADNLVSTVIHRLAEVFAEEHSKLEQQWERGDNVSTEDLRVTLQHYRSFFTRLLSV